MPGFTEILIIIAIILAIFILPKRFGRKPEPAVKRRKQGLNLIVLIRIAVMASILWLAFCALYLLPWNNGWLFFIYVGPGPVVLFWGISLIVFVLVGREK